LVDQDMDLGGASAARAADGLVPLPPFAPLAARCARTAVLSIIITLGGSAQLASAPKIPCHRPRLLHRLYRLSTDPRMGSARQVAKLRDQHSGNPSRAAETPLLTASVDEIVRYLRQQNDIVVAEENGFLVNGRFHMPLADLVARANRMRSRQGKSEFD
jgi:hypothetical protein